MTQDEMIAVITAFKEGKQIQIKLKVESEDCWSDCLNPGFNFTDCDYRIKPEPKYRPFKDADECFAEIKKHGGWVKRKSIKIWCAVGGVNNENVDAEDIWITFAEFFYRYVWADDGSPCGILDE